MPRQQRLIMAIRGGAGVGKSHFVSSMAEAGLGKLCIFDTERKARLLRGVGQTFDALEIEQTDELPEFIEWAINGEGREQNYGCFGLDSWAAYFSAKHSEMLEAVREEPATLGAADRRRISRRPDDFAECSAKTLHRIGKMRRHRRSNSGARERSQRR
jgi:hypothetical protein